MSAAAARLHLAQATVSEALADLERTLGVGLLARAPRRRAVPTPAGRELLPEARAVLTAAARVGERSAELRGTVAGSLPVGFLVTLAPVVAPRVFAAFETRWPEARAVLRTGDQQELFGWLRESAIDLAVTYDLGLDDTIHFEALAAYPPYALFGAGHRLAGRRSVTLPDLAREPLVLLDLPLSREYFLSLFRDAALEPVIDRHAGDPELVRSLVAHGYGYTLANARPVATQAVDGTPLRAVPVRGRVRAPRIGLARRAHVEPTRTAIAFAEACAAVLEQGSTPRAAAALPRAAPGPARAKRARSAP